MFLLRMKLGFIVLFMAIFCAGTMAVLSNPYAPATTDEAVFRIADRLVEKQVKTGALKGTWPSMGGVTAGYFTGTIAAGLVDAYAMTGVPDYKAAAELAGNYIWHYAPDCSIYYDEAYAFMLLSQIDCNPDSNQWRTALRKFYACLEAQPFDPDYDKAGTELYVAQIEAFIDPPYATFEVAYYTVVAYYMDTPQKAIWRSELIRLLQTSNASSGEQIYALGAATWALSQTGPLDSTPVYVGSPFWGYFPGGVATQLSKLPQLLATYQVPASYTLNAYQFNPIYLPANRAFSGWTETNIYAVMGLDAADNNNSSLYHYRSQIDATWAVNMQPVDFNGDVWYDAINAPATGGDNVKCYHYAGEYLQYLAATRLPGDINLNDEVEFDDLQILAINWLGPTGCQWSVADLNRDHKVNLQDLSILSQGWLLAR